ncbi:hypothetical protein P8V03_09090 [Clostridium sp. A1-XYC3]|uniref:Uncharacterized protein n=1 Tax=Clostridium tanneri TaxID=3037988 RepID=A0ABU4JTS4_9CLOT|nr:hypothetical protein [Clostridium sp. A1-XYC3]MDW8801308.1 hypothetical protein [Clostridium sp. A1-XYC3]
MDENSKAINIDSPLYEGFEEISTSSECCCPTTARPTTARPTTSRPTTVRPTTAAPTQAPCTCCSAEQRPITYDKCELEKTETFNNVTLDCTGRLLDVNVTLRNVCPNKRIAVAVLVYEGSTLLSLKVCRLFSGDGSNCIPTLNAGRFCFVFDDDPCPPARTLTVRIVANYLER